MQQVPRSRALDRVIPNDGPVSIAFRLDRDLVAVMEELATERE